MQCRFFHNLMQSTVKPVNLLSLIVVSWTWRNGRNAFQHTACPIGCLPKESGILSVLYMHRERTAALFGSEQEDVLDHHPLALLKHLILIQNECTERNFPSPLSHQSLCSKVKYCSNRFICFRVLLHRGVLRHVPCPTRKFLPFSVMSPSVMSGKHLSCCCHSTYSICVCQERGDGTFLQVPVLGHVLQCHHGDEQ